MTNLFIIIKKEREREQGGLRRENVTTEHQNHKPLPIVLSEVDGCEPRKLKQNLGDGTGAATEAVGCLSKLKILPMQVEIIQTFAKKKF